MNFSSCIFIVAAALVLANAEQCEKPCTKILRPVCGSDGQNLKTFANRCVMENEHCRDGRAWTETRMGDCNELKELSDCLVVCPKIFKPVCGSDGQNFRVFPNSCELQNQFCRDGRPWMATHSENCQQRAALVAEPCEKACTREYLPVCGTDGQQFKVFSNLCVMENQHCKDGRTWLMTRMDSCANIQENELLESCATMCPAVYAPVCGFDGKTYRRFSNQCMMNAIACQESHSWTLSTLSNCPGSL